MPSPRQLYEAFAASKKADNEVVELATAIRVKLKRLRITLDQVAEWEGVSRRKLNYWLAGKHLLNYRRQEQGRVALRRILRWLERIEAGTERRPAPPAISG
jgi:septation ring formation regulator EzrA